MVLIPMAALALLIPVWADGATPDDPVRPRGFAWAYSLVGVAVAPALAVAMRGHAMDQSPTVVFMGGACLGPLVGLWAALMWTRPRAAVLAAVGTLAGVPLTCAVVVLERMPGPAIGVVNVVGVMCLVAWAPLVAALHMIRQGWRVVLGLLPLMMVGPYVELHQLFLRDETEFCMVFEARFALRAAVLLWVGVAGDLLLRGRRAIGLLALVPAALLTVPGTWTVQEDGQQRLLGVSVGEPLTAFTGCAHRQVGSAPTSGT